MSDYASGDDKGWVDLRETLSALAAQDYDGDVEYLLAECEAYRDRVPDDLRQLLPDLVIRFFGVTSSYALKNEAAKVARGELIGVLDGDCTPDPGWVRHLAATFERFPETDVVSGRTIYRSASVTERIIGLLSRGYLDRGRPGPTDSIANNNSGFRRGALLSHPFLDDIGAFGGKLQAESMLRAGMNFRFEPRMLAAHAYEGWAMERDIRRNSGYATVIVRKIDPRIGFSWLARMGPAAIPAFFTGRLLLSWLMFLRLFRFYDVGVTAVPRALLLAAFLHWLEIPGMRLAFGGKRITETAYR